MTAAWAAVGALAFGSALASPLWALLLILTPSPNAPDPSSAFLDALSRARANVTEDAERPLLDTLTATAPAALSGEPAARAEAIAALRALAAINRDSMRRADIHAQRLGTAGAWAAVALAIAASLLGVGAMRRLNLRFVKPILDLHATARAFHAGDLLRRCPQPDPQRTLLELSNIARALNALLDAHLAHTCAPAPPPSTPTPKGRAACWAAACPAPCTPGSPTAPAAPW